MRREARPPGRLARLVAGMLQRYNAELNLLAWALLLVAALAVGGNH